MQFINIQVLSLLVQIWNQNNSVLQESEKLTNIRKFSHSLLDRSSAGRVDAFEDFRRNDWRLTQSGMVSKSTSSAAPRDLAAAERNSVISASLTQQH